MREILFRGKRVDNGEWVYGLLCRVGDTYANIVRKDTWVLYSVLTNTIGQCTGLTDKNGRKIFEGDIVKFPHGTKSMNGKIEYIEEDCIYYLTYKTDRMPFGVFFNGFELEIIGNIHDNPELLEVTE